MEISCEAVLCDLDGTLIDSGPAVTDAWTRFAAEIGMQPQELLDICHGVRTTEVIQSLGLGLPVMPTALRVESWIMAAGSHPTPGAVEFLAALPSDRSAVVTSSLLPTAESRFANTALIEPAVLVTAESVAKGKPDPEGYLRAAELLGVAPSECLVIEDAPAGVEAGVAAGMTVLAVTTTHQARDLAEAHHVVPDLSEVVVRVDGLRLLITDGAGSS